MKSSLSIIIPAFNEEGNIKTAIKNVLWAIRGKVPDYEIIVIDDGSSDRTGKILDGIAGKNQRIKIVHHRKNLGLGFVFRSGLKKATKTYVSIYPGDGDLSAESYRKLVGEMGRKELIITYMLANTHRSLMRRILSRIYVASMNFLFCLNLKYYNGAFICRLKLLKKLPLKSSSYTIFSEMFVRLIKKGISYKEIPFDHVGRKHQKSKAVSLRSLRGAIQTIIILLREVNRP